MLKGKKKDKEKSLSYEESCYEQVIQIIISKNLDSNFPMTGIT